jgi:hypothetical protein
MARPALHVVCALEPNAGRHFTFATPDRSGFVFAQVAVHLGDGIPGSENDPLGNGQPQHPSPEGAFGCLRPPKWQQKSGIVSPLRA